MIYLIVALFSAIGGLGIVLMVGGLRSTQKSLGALETQGAANPGSVSQPVETGWFGWVDENLDERSLNSLRSNLAILNMGRSAFERNRLSAMVVGFFAPTGVLMFLNLLGFGFPSPTFLVVMSFASAVVGFFWYWWKIGSDAKKKRVVLRHGSSMFLDLAVLQLAGGAGVSASLASASERGDGEAFRRIRTALEVASTQGQTMSPYESLRQLGEDLELPDLIEVGNSMDRADSTGGEVKSTLRRQAKRVRVRLAQEETAAAGSRSVTMTLPQVFMVMGFMIFLLFPFLAALLSAEVGG